MSIFIILSFSFVDPPKIRATNRNITAVTGATKAVHVSVGGSITAVRGMSIIINCPASGIPAPKIRWMRKDHYFIIDPRIGLTIDNALHIDALESGDAGVYTCEAENKAGKDSASTKLIVAGKHHISITAYYLHCIEFATPYPGPSDVN